ncbi:hypothetical protein T03_15375, partial [Trichinella britovi]
LALQLTTLRGRLMTGDNIPCNERSQRLFFI